MSDVSKEIFVVGILAVASGVLVMGYGVLNAEVVTTLSGIGVAGIGLMIWSS